MRNKILCLCLSLFMVVSYLPASVMTAFAAPIDNLETNEEDTSPKLILDKESDIKDVFVYKILDGSEYEKDAFGLISYTDSFKKDFESSKEFIEVDDFYSKLLDLFKDIKDLEDVDKKSSSDNKDESEKVEKEITQEDINEESLKLYDEISEFLDESKQLQFNKDRELIDLTEGVYLIFSENMYPQFINITDSDKDVNIKLEENKSDNKDAQKNISDNETPKATPKKGGPLKIASPDTEGLATDVSISKFELSITGNSGNFETINDQQVYVIKPGNAYETKKLNWKLEYALSATGSYPAESIEIRIPRYYANKLNLDNTETLYTSSSVVPSVPAYPSYNSSGFGYKYDSSTKEYVITNVIGIDGGSTGFFEFEYEYNQYTNRIKDETLQIPLTATLNIQTGDEGLKTQDSNEINWMYDTAVEARNINSLLNNKYDTWQDEWGEAPANADDYFYVTYAFSGEIRKPSSYPGTTPTQSYTVQINNNTWNNDFVYGWINYHNSISTDSSTGLKYSQIYYTSNNPMDPNTYKSMYDDSNIRKFNTSNMQDGVIFTDYASSYPAWYDGIVLARYPKSLQTETEYDVENIITMTVHPTNGNDEDSTVTYTRTDTLKNINWETPTGNYSLNKSTYRSTLYGLKSLAEGSSIGHIYYRSNFSGSNYQKTVIPGESIDDPNNYGKRNVHYEFVDDMLFLSDENTLLGPNDYEFESLYAGPLKLSDYVADDSTGQYISQAILTSDSRYKSFIENGGLVCWGKYEDGWKKLATITVDSSNKVTWQIEDTSLVSAQGSAVSFNSSTSLTIPYLRLVKSSGCIGYKFTVDSNMYQVELGTISTTSGDNYNNVVRLLGSDRVKTWASNHLSTGGYLYNLNTLNVTDSEGNNLALEGEIQEDSDYTNDINRVLTAINTKDTTDYGRPLFHDAVRTKLEPFNVTSGITKDYSNTTNDTTNEVYKINYDIYGAAEEYKGLPVDAIVTDNVLNDNAYEYLVENNYIDDFTEDYIFYDLLPKGLVVNEATIKVRRTTNLYTNSYTTSSTHYLREDMSTMSPNEYDYEIIPNYNNSGRDMLKVTCHTKPGIHVYSNTAVRMYSLHYTGLYSWDSFFDYGTTLRNIVATKWGTTSIANGKPDNGPTGSNYTNEEKLTMTNLDPTADNPNFLYTYHTHKISAGVSGTSGLYKRVKGSKGDFETNSTVSPQSIYQYKIRYAAESNTEVSSIVFYDSLENYKPTGVTESWKGKLQSIDVSQLESKGINVKIYYSNTNNLDISQHQDLNDSVWISADTYGSDLSNVKAFAIDCRYKTNSEEFILGEKESLAVIVNMLSDVSNPNELFENNIKAYNEIYSRIKVRRLSQDFGIENLIHQGYTSIGITVPTTKFIGQKRWLDENDTIRPESVTIELLRNGTPYREQTITANNNWKFEFNDLLKQDNNLEDYVYSVREKSTPNNYTAEIENDLSYYNGTAITFGDHFATESTSYDWVSIYYKDENNNLQQLRGQGSSSGKWGGSQTSSNSLAGKTIYVPSKDVYIYWRSDSSNVAYGFDVISMDLTHIEDITTIQSATATLPTNNIIENSDILPATPHDYSNYEESLWHYTMGSGNFSLITNKQTSKSISGQKIWSGDTQSARPESITVKLLRNGEEYQSKSVTAANNWQYTFNNLPVFDENDNLYHYTIEESHINGYITRYSNGETTVETPTEGYNDIENIWNPRVITITKQWLNSKGGDDTEFRPEDITVHLKRKQNPLQKIVNLFRTQVVDEQHTLELEYITDPTKWVKDGNTWTYTFSIPENEYDWEVYEEAIEYYTESNLIANPAEVENNIVTITNDFEPQLHIKGTKHWPESDEAYRPESITVNLLRNNQIINTKEVSVETNWEYDFGYYPIYDSNNNEYNYSLSENQLDDYISQVDEINASSGTYAIKFGNIDFYTEANYDYVQIFYLDEDNNLKKLTGQGSDSNGRWQGNKNASTSLFDKTIYVPSNIFYVYWISDTTNVGYGFDVDSIIPTNIPDDITITSTAVTSLPVSESNAILITNSTLPGTTHDYSNYESKLWKYEGVAGANEFNITNILNKQSINGTKTWVGDSPENRPESITVNLYQDGRKIDSQEVTADNNWSYAFTNVPIYKSDGSTKYEYYVEEEPVENYFTNYDKSHAGVRVTFGNDLSITNSNAFMTILYKNLNGSWTRLIGQGSTNTGQWNSSNINSLKNKTLEVPSLEFYITWHGINTSQKWDVTKIEVCDNISVSAETTETYSTAEAIQRAYSLAENVEIDSNTLPVAPYNNKYEVLYHFNGTNEYKSVNLINTYNLKNIPGSKTWIGDTASNRPENITVNLYQDGRKIAETTTDASKNWQYIFENVPIYHNDQITEYEYYVTENPVENYYNVPTRSNTKITFGSTFGTYNSSDYLSIYYKDENDNFKQLTGQGSDAGKWYGSSTYSLAGKSIYLPGNEFYLYFYSNNSSNSYGFDVTDIQAIETIDNNISITSVDISSLPTHTTPIEVVDESTYPKTAHNYSNSMTQMWHYKGVGNGKSLDVVNEYNLFNINGTVRWQGDSDNKGLRPDKVILDLYQNDVLLTTQELTVTSDDIQDFVFNDIPRLDENGNEYHYVVHQRDIDNYRTSNIDDLNILNECTKRNVTGYKVWVNDKNRNSRPESIKVILYDENNDKIAEKTVTSADEFRENCWKYTFENIDVFDNNGNIKSYHVEEEIDTKEYYTGYIPNYWYRYSSEVQSLLSASAEDIYKGKVELPSNILDEALEAFGKYLQDNNIEFPYTSWENLTSEQQEIFTNWTNNYLEDLADQYFDENHLYGYNYDLGNSYAPVVDGPIYSESKLAASVEQLSPQMDLTSIVNVYRVKHLDGVKHWEDEGSQYQRPDSVTLGLYRNGEKVDEQVITADNGWEYSFTDLPEVDKDGNPYEYDIKEEDLENYITEYNQGDVTEGVEVTFSLPIENSSPIYKLQSSNKRYISYSYSKWEQNNIYNNFSSKYGLVAVFKDGNTWYKMTLGELKSSYDGGFEKLSTKAAASSSVTPLPSAPSGITFIIPSKEFYIIPVFRYTDYVGGGVELMSTKAMATISSNNEVPGLVSYKPVKLSKDDKAKLNYVRSVSKVEFPVDPYIDVFDYHMYNRNESGILFEKLSSSFNINDEVEHVIELKEAQLTDFLDEYITDIDTGNDWEVEKWIHNVAYHYKEQLGLTNYPLDAKTSYSGTKIWDENDTPDESDDVPDSPPIPRPEPKAMAKASNNLTVKEATRPAQPTSVTVVLLQDGKQYATQTIGEDTDWKFEFNDLPMFDQTDHHKYIYSIKEKSVKGYKSEVTDEGKNGHQVVISSDIYMNLYNNMHILAHYNGNWYDCDSLPRASSYSIINNKIKIYIPGDDFKIVVNGRTITQNEISEEVEYEIENGKTPENYLTIDSIKAVNIPYAINNDSEGIYYTTLSGYNYFWYQVPQSILESELSEGNNINITDGSIHSISIDQILEGYDSTNSDDQYSDIFNIYNYTSTNIEGLQIKNTYYEGSFKVKKVDEKGQILPGCEFSLYYADGLTWTKLENDPTAVSVSDENGIVTFNNIPYGDYLMYETHPADGYKTPSKPWKVSINTNGSATIWDENGKMVPIEGTDKDYDLSNGVKITFNSETDIPYNYMYILAKNEQTNSAVVYSLRSSLLSSTYSNKSIEIPTKDFYIIFMNEGGGSTKVSSNDILSKGSSTSAPYGFKVEKIEPIRTSWTNIYYTNTYNITYDSYEYDGMTWDEFMNNSLEMIDIIECNNYPESKHYEEFTEYLMKDKSTAWHYDSTLNSSSQEDYDNDALFEGTIITFGNNNHASVDSENVEQYYTYPVLLFEYDKQYYIVRLPNNPTELNNLSIKVPSNNIWLAMSGQYVSAVNLLRSSTVPQTGVDYGYDLGNEIIDVKSIAKTIMTKSDVENALNSAYYQIPKSMESEFKPEFELTAGPQEIHWISDVLGDKDAEESVQYQAFYHYQNDASGLIPKYEIPNELTRTETILVNTEDEPIPGGILQIIDKDGNVVDSWSTTEENHITLGLTEGEEYTIHQESTPYPYRVATDDTFVVLQGEITYVKVINDKLKDLTISKDVSGSASNTDDIFNYHITITNGEPNVNHIVETPNGNLTLTTDATGSGQLDITMKHSESVTIKGVYKDAIVNVTEQANAYVATYRVNNGERITNPTSNMDLTSTVTMGDTDVSILYENVLTGVLPTGVYLTLKDMLPFILMVLLLFGVAEFYSKNKKKKLNLNK